MNLVYKAEDTLIGRSIALKFLPYEFSADPPKQATPFTSGQTFNFAWWSKCDLVPARGSYSSDVVLIRNSQ